MSFDPKHSVRQIRRRLLRLLLLAFGSVVALMIVLVLAVFAVVTAVAARGEPVFQSPQARLLEGYYIGRGSWDGVEALAQSEGWGDMVVVVDADNRVVLDGGRVDTPRVGQPYTGPTTFPERVTIPLHANGQPIGAAILDVPQRLQPFDFIVGLLPPVGFVSIFLAALTLLIGVLLARRFINPLADVIAAAQAVAGGDLSARVEVRGPEDLRALTDSFNHMADALQRSDRERRAMLTDIAHELRTPLTVMRGKLEGFIDGVYPVNETTIAPVLEETYTLERLVEDLRLLTLVEARQLHFDLRPTSLAELAARAISLFDAEANEKRITLTLDAPPDIPNVNADGQRVSQVIGNLLSNALRYVPEGGAVAVAVRREANGVSLTVSDTGPGVAEADLPHLFDRFWRGEKSRARASGGAGLGLAIAKQLIEAQGGTITARNRPEGGLAVSFTLPLEKLEGSVNGYLSTDRQTDERMVAAD
ncbi:MAG: ATP-binding protein [Anaerolineales bacterium]|nr:ATP-binding protein [Anaerolineales bacterium]